MLFKEQKKTNFNFACTKNFLQLVFPIQISSLQYLELEQENLATNQCTSAIGVGFIWVQSTFQQMMHQNIISSNGRKTETKGQVHPSSGQHALCLCQHSFHYWAFHFFQMLHHCTQGIQIAIQNMTLGPKFDQLLTCKRFFMIIVPSPTLA